MAEARVIGSGWTAEQFESATPREVQWRLEWLDEADRREWRRTAQLAAWVLQALGSRMTADDLVGAPKARRFDSF